MGFVITGHMYMKRKVYLKLTDQNELCQKFNLNCAFDISIKTCFTTFSIEHDLCEVVLILLSSGTILQKWHCKANDDGTFSSLTIYTTEMPIVETPIVCDIEQCAEVSNDNNIQCYLCGEACNVLDTTQE